MTSYVQVSSQYHFIFCIFLRTEKGQPQILPPNTNLFRKRSFQLCHFIDLHPPCRFFKRIRVIFHILLVRENKEEFRFRETLGWNWFRLGSVQLSFSIWGKIFILFFLYFFLLFLFYVYVAANSFLFQSGATRWLLCDKPQRIYFLLHTHSHTHIYTYIWTFIRI